MIKHNIFYKTGRISVVTVSGNWQATFFWNDFTECKCLTPYHYQIKIELLTKKRPWALLAIIENRNILECSWP